MDEPRRDEQVGLKITSVERAEIVQAATYADMPVAAWCRRELLRAARGERAAKNVEVPLGDLAALQASVDRLARLEFAVLNVLLEHTHHGDPVQEHEDPNLRTLGRRRAARKMADLMKDLGLENGSAAG